MKTRMLVAAVTLIAASACSTADVAAPVAKSIAAPTAVANGFDMYGYNDVAGIFSGPADGVDKVLDGKVWGDATYANDHLAMKWNKAWTACNAAQGTSSENTPAACAGAWTDNEWNGAFAGGSGAVWHYKIIWVGLPCGSANPNWSDGGYCVWGSYETLMDQGQDPSYGIGHLWFTHATQNGYGN